MNETHINKSGDFSNDLQYHTLCKLGEALYIRNRNRERAQKASDAVDYLVEQEVFDG